MSDDKDKSLEAIGDEKLEARIVAWLLGEASAFEAEELEKRSKEDPEMGLFVRRIRLIHGLLEKPKEDDAGWKLSAEKRQKVMDLFGADEEVLLSRHKRRMKRRQWISLAAAACLMLAVLFGLHTVYYSPLAKQSPVIVSYSAESAAVSDDVTQLRTFGRRAYRSESELQDLSELAAKELPATLAAPTSVDGEQDLLARQPTAPAKMKPTAPGSSMSKVVVSGSASDKAIPVPEVELAGTVSEFGVSSDFGSGWAGAGSDGEVRGEHSSGTGRTAQLRDGVALGRLFRYEATGGFADTDAFAASDETKSEEVSERESLRFAGQVGGGTDLGDLGSSSRVAGSIYDVDDEGSKVEVARDTAVPSVTTPTDNVDYFAAPVVGNQVDARRKKVDSRHLGLDAKGENLPPVPSEEPVTPTPQMQGEGVDRPVRTNPALTSDQAPKSVALRQSLYKAQGYHDLGQFDEAEEEYNNALRVDPYNKAARRGLERVASAKSSYYRAAYDHTRAELLAEVDAAWEMEVPAEEDASKDAESGEVLTRKSADGITTREFDVPPDFLSRITANSSDEPLGDYDAFAPPADKGSALAPRMSMTEALESNGIAFLDDSSAQFLAADGKLIIRNTEDNLALVELLIAESKDATTPEAALDLMAEVSATEDPYSTFSLNVSDASFKLASAAMERGEVPEKESIRPEEFYNAFDYGDPAPTAGEPVACVIEQAAHPAFLQRNVMRVAVRTGAAGRSQTSPLNLTLLLDNSGSMERQDRAEGVANAVEQLSSLLQPGDKVTFAGFARQPRLLADQLDGAQADQLNGLVAQLPSEGGTNLEEALVLGEELAMRQYVDGAQNRVVLFTDGAANLGDADPESLNSKIETMRQNGIAFDAAGFGADGLNDRMLERLTRNGNGRYYVVDDPADADEGFAKQLAGAFRPAAENVKVQVVFNPDRVGNYKLIGFEEHRLKKEDFRNDSVDAAEMAAEEAGVALYQFEVLPEGRGEIGEVSVRFRDTSTGEMVERNWTIPYDAQAPAFDQAKQGVQLATLAALTAEKLRDAPMAGAVDLNELRPVLDQVTQKYGKNPKIKKLSAMMDALR